MKILKLAIFLAVVSAASGLCLSYVNDLTSPIIEQRSLELETAALEEMFPGATFTKTEIDGEYVTAEYVCDDGVAYNVTVTGYGGDIDFIIAIDNDGNYIGFNVTDCSNETSGFGSQVGDEAFKEQVLSKNVDTQVDTISGATISSSAVQAGIDEAAELFKSR